MTITANDHNHADNLPLVSIVIPTFNQGQYLSACVDHCLFQTYQNIELIIVDGGSNDGTKEYLASLPATIIARNMQPVIAMSKQGEIIRKTIQVCPQDRNLQIISFPADIGATRTINEGLTKATGKYCTYVVGDDLPHPHMIEEMVAALENSGVDFVYADMNLVDDQGNIVRQMRLPDYDPQICFAQWYHLGVCRLYRSEWHAKIGLMDENYQSANDYDHYLRFAMAGCRFYHLPRVLYSIRWHGENRKTGQHTNERYANLMDESQRCATRARQWLAANQRPCALKHINNGVQKMADSKKALITGITGQDGSYLAELLLDKGYEVYGLVRRVAFEDESHRMHRITHLLDRINLVPGSLESFPSLYNAIRTTEPDEVYHLAAQSYVSNSMEDEFSTLNTNINGTHNILAACRDLAPNTRFYFAGTSEMFGCPSEVPQQENTPFNPRSAYGISKVAGFQLTRNYRENYGMFTCSGILYNHESPRRGFEFVTRKITSHVAMIKLGRKDHLELGNLDAQRDWGHAREYMEAIWLMLQQETPGDYVICTGQLHSVRDFCDEAFSYVGLDYRDYVRTSEKFYRPDAEKLVGSPAKAEATLAWRSKIPFRELVHEMVEHDLAAMAAK